MDIVEGLASHSPESSPAVVEPLSSTPVASAVDVPLKTVAARTIRAVRASLDLQDLANIFDLPSLLSVFCDERITPNLTTN